MRFYCANGLVYCAAAHLRGNFSQDLPTGFHECQDDQLVKPHVDSVVISQFRWLCLLNRIDCYV